MKIDINMNDEIIVNLTEAGLKIYEKSTNKAQLLPQVKLPLWEAMRIFGDGMYNGSKIPFEKNIISIVKD